MRFSRKVDDTLRGITMGEYIDDMLVEVKDLLLEVVPLVHDHDTDDSVMAVTVSAPTFGEKRWESVKAMCAETMKVVGASHYHQLGDRYDSTIFCDADQAHMEACLKMCYSALMDIKKDAAMDVPKYTHTHA